MNYKYLGYGYTKNLKAKEAKKKNLQRRQRLIEVAMISVVVAGIVWTGLQPSQYTITQTAQAQTPEPAMEEVDLCSLEAVVCDGEETPEQIIRRLAPQYGVSTETALRIAKCESGLDPNAKNPKSSATGIYQWLTGTWEYIGNPGDRTNAEDSIKAFLTHYPNHPGWWTCK